MSHLRREIEKLLFQRRAYLGWAGLLAVPLLMTLALRLSADPPRPGEGPPFLANILNNGLYVPVSALAALSFFLLPLVCAMTGAFVIAGEAEMGTLKSLLSRPVSRGGLLLSKWAVAVLYVAVGLLLVAAGATLAGWLVFGLQPMTTLSGGTLPVPEALRVIGMAYLFALLGMTCVVSLALLFSTLTDSSLTAAIAALVVVIVMQILGQFSYFDFLRPYLFTDRFQDWFNLLRQPIAWAPLRDGALVFVSYIVALTGLAWLVFRRKDILS
jgi:ABC-2 type transport system permease protein